MLPLYLCPKCKKTLYTSDKSYVCENKHSYDIASEGYVNLFSGKIQGGDSKEMCRARRDFLAEQYYAPLADKLSEIVKRIEAQSIVDMGCGEGFYDRQILKETNATVCGIDLSKEAVRLAAKAGKREEENKSKFCVASIFEMPFADNSFDAALSVFAPVPYEEARRVLKKNGKMIVVTPGKNHLDGLKAAVYENPYDNDEKQKLYDGFSVSEIYRVNSKITVYGNNISNLFLMTPYYWKTSESDAAKLKLLDKLTTSIDFIVTVYTKNE